MAKSFSATVVLIRGYPLLSLSLLTEPWRLANEIAGKTIVTWGLTTWNGKPLAAAGGEEITLEGEAKKVDAAPDMVIVVGGNTLLRAPEKPLITWLKRMDEAGVLVAGVGAGADVLAKAGLMEAGGGGVPMEAAQAFDARHLGAGLAHGLFSVIGNRAAAAGGTAPLDFSLGLIERRLGAEMANWVSEALVYRRRPSEIDALIKPSDMRRGDERLTTAVRWLSSLLSGDHGSVRSAAVASGLSERQLLRLFHDTFSQAPRRYQEALRLYRARTLLGETSMTIIAIALAVGFAGGPELSRAYQRQFNESPTAYRERVRSEV